MREGIQYARMPSDLPLGTAFEETALDHGETPRERALALLDEIHSTAKRVGATFVHVGKLRFDGPGETGTARTEAVYYQ